MDFPLCLAGAGLVLSKTFSVVTLPVFRDLWLRQTSFPCSFSFFISPQCLLGVGNWRLLEPLSRIHRWQSEAEEIHGCVIYQVPESLRILSSFHHSESFYVCCYLQGLLVLRGRAWEERGYSNLVGTRSHIIIYFGA